MIRLTIFVSPIVSYLFLHKGFRWMIVLEYTLLCLEYKSRGFSQKLRPGELLHGHNFIAVQHILIEFWWIVSIDLERVYHKYHYEWLRPNRVMTFQSLTCLLFQCVLYSYSSLLNRRHVSTIQQDFIFDWCFLLHPGWSLERLMCLLLHPGFRLVAEYCK